ncbi:hypothetical protein [Parabacteroides sp. FAFU027]|nr:hypothetical protein [Parabacteroides sp. FAFU027]
MVMILDNFFKALTATAIGMLSIFIFMLLFYLVIVLLEKYFPGKKEEQKG